MPNKNFSDITRMAAALSFPGIWLAIYRMFMRLNIALWLLAVTAGHAVTGYSLLYR